MNRNKRRGLWDGGQLISLSNHIADRELFFWGVGLYKKLSFTHTIISRPFSCLCLFSIDGIHEKYRDYVYEMIKISLLGMNE
jgi:hypothetical protein